MTIRMKDIAKDLGISQATVSKVLREHPDIGEETRRRVLERVKELDYQPNALARSLVTGRSYLIGLVAPSLLHPFFAQIAKSLSNEIRNKGYSLIVSSSRRIRTREGGNIAAAGTALGCLGRRVLGSEYRAVPANGQQGSAVRAYRS